MVISIYQLKNAKIYPETSSLQQNSKSNKKNFVGMFVKIERIGRINCGTDYSQQINGIVYFVKPVYY